MVNGALVLRGHFLISCPVEFKCQLEKEPRIIQNVFAAPFCLDRKEKKQLSAFRLRVERKKLCEDGAMWFSRTAMSQIEKKSQQIDP